MHPFCLDGYEPERSWSVQSRGTTRRPPAGRPFARHRSGDLQIRGVRE